MISEAALDPLVVDTSALVAILREEAEKPLYDELLAKHPVFMAQATRVELAVVCRRKLGRNGIALGVSLLAIYEVAMVDLDDRQAAVALAAFDRFGKGRGAPPAALNYGDLFSYALAKTRDLPLLYKGDDFTRTDVRSAVVELAAQAPG